MKTKIFTLTIALVVSGLFITSTAYGNFFADNAANEYDQALYINDNENALEIEQWMKNRDYFFSVFAETEQQLTLEGWMKDRRYFKRAIMAEENESAPVIEFWMTDLNYFRSLENHVDEEEKLEIEPWMADTGYFRSISYDTAETLDIEPWMTDLNYFRSSLVAEESENSPVKEIRITTRSFGPVSAPHQRFMININVIR